MKRCQSKTRSESSKFHMTWPTQETVLKRSMSPVRKHGKPGLRQVAIGYISRKRNQGTTFRNSFHTCLRSYILSLKDLPFWGRSSPAHNYAQMEPSIPDERTTPGKSTNAQCQYYSTENGVRCYFQGQCKVKNGKVVLA